MLSFFAFFSCLDDDNVLVSYGVIRNVNSTNRYEIFTDKGNTLMVNTSHSSETIENDKRVLVNYEVLSDKEKNKKLYEVSVNGFYNLLSKPVVYESFILEDEETRRDSIGNDPFNRIQAGFGGDYINIDFEVQYARNSSTKHMINLVYDDTRTDTDSICLTIYHNAYGEIPGNDLYLQKGLGRSSFKISDLLPAGVSARPVKITWTEYGNNHNPVVRTTSGTFKVGASGTNNYLERNIGLDSSIEIK
jgi:hypothetical protein